MTRVGLACRLPSGSEQYTLAEQIEIGPTVRLSLQHFDPVDVAFDRS
jgi:hypothetical protein